MRFSRVDAQLWPAILGMCVEPGKMCMGEMMMIDRKGGLGLGAVGATLPLLHDKYGRNPSVLASSDAYVLSICTPTDDGRGKARVADQARQARAEPFAAQAAPSDRLTGAGLSPVSARFLPALSVAPGARAPSES
jgi:cytochrome o ubiquinol oxidase subunit 2